MGINHAFVSAKSDGGDATLVRPSNWNADHPITGTLAWDGATVTVSTPLLDLSQTWNAGAITFTALKLNVTDTASAAGSLLMDLQRDSASQFHIDKTSMAELLNGTSAAGLRVYNIFTDASNYERGVFDWTTTGNKLTIGMQALGTGTNRSVTLTCNNLSSFNVGPDGAASHSDSGGVNWWSLRGGFGELRLSGFTAITFSSSSNRPDLTAADIGLDRVAAKVAQFNDGTAANANGWMQWAGQARVTSDFTVTSSTTLVNVTGLSVSVQAGRTYHFETELYVTDAAAGGVQAAIAGTATATAIQYTGYTIADNAIKGKTNATALATAVGSTVTTETAGIVTRITGTITVNAAGTLTVQMAQNTSNGTATTAKRGSHFLVYDMP